MHLGEEDDIDQVRTQRPENRGFVNYHYVISRMLRMCFMLEILRIFTKDRRWWVLWGPWRLPSHRLQRWPLASPTWSQSHSPVTIHLTSKMDIRERENSYFSRQFCKIEPICLREGALLHYLPVTDWLADVSLLLLKKFKRLPALVSFLSLRQFLSFDKPNWLTLCLKISLYTFLANIEEAERTDESENFILNCLTYMYQINHIHIIYISYIIYIISIMYYIYIYDIKIILILKNQRKKKKDEEMMMKGWQKIMIGD